MTKGQLLLVVPLALLLASGCGPKNPGAPAQVSGTVTYNGAPVKGGTITFHNKDSAMFAVPIRQDGTYKSTDLPIGEMVVTVETESINPNKKPGGKNAAQYSKMQGQQQKPPSDAVASQAEYTKIPEKYADPKKSPLKTTLNVGKQEFPIALTD